VENATILKVSDEELDFVNDIIFKEKLSVEQSLERYKEAYKNLKVIIITLGAKGVIAYERSST
jgi:sugar/nucleoside kinase (ribokinase family)